VNCEDFMSRYPILFHLAAADSWPSIRESGLLSTDEILRRWEVPQVKADVLRSRRRPESVVIDHPAHGRAVLRHQRPLSEARLATALTDGMTVAEWLRMLNSFVFILPVRGKAANAARRLQHADRGRAQASDEDARPGAQCPRPSGGDQHRLHNEASHTP